MHTCLHHLSWFLFGLSPCWVLVLVVIFMTSPSSPKTDLVWKTFCVFRLEILSVHLRDRVHTFPYVVKLLSLPFQQNWIHLFWSSNEKVIAFQVFLFFMVRKFRSFSRKFRVSEVPGEVPMQVPLSIVALGCFHFISGSSFGSWLGSSGGAELPLFVSEVPALRKNWPTGRFLTYPEVPG